MSEPTLEEDHERPVESIFDASTFDLNEDPVEEILESLYRPGAYREGEAICIEILEELDPDWEPAKIFLLLNLAAQNFEEEALEMLDELADNSLFEALRLVVFGEGTDAEVMIYEDIIACAEARGLDDQLQTFFNSDTEEDHSAMSWLEV